MAAARGAWVTRLYQRVDMEARCKRWNRPQMPRVRQQRRKQVIPEGEARCYEGGRPLNRPLAKV